jgi:hypothetical protein
MPFASRTRSAVAVVSIVFAVLVLLVTTVASPAYGIDYPAPGGIYAPFTDCPLRNPAMLNSVPGSATGCIASVSSSGSFSINGITVAITHPVIVQFGVFSPPNAQPSQFSGGVVQTPDGKGLVTSPEPTPGGLPVFICPGTTPALARLCQTAKTSGQTQLSALVQSAGPIDNFNLTTFTQPVKIRLINPLLGGNCFIGSNTNPIVLNPSITSGNLGFEPDPNPTRFPTTDVLSITDAVATDDTFSVPTATGCGPNGIVNAPINALLGLPSPSGHNHLVLNGTSSFADDFSSTVPQATDLLAAFKASVGT